MSAQPPFPHTQQIGFIGGGNMASAIVGGLIRLGRPADSILVVDPSEEQRQRLERDYGVQTMAQAQRELRGVGILVWAVKPQQFAEAAAMLGQQAGPLHFSVMAGIRTDAIGTALGSQRIVRAMPNTPALIGQGITGLYAGAPVQAHERAAIEQLIAPTGVCLWVAQEADLDAVTALSGSGPAYVFYFIEAMTRAGVEMGLSAEQAQQLAVQTFSGATALVQQSGEAPAALRERVTSKGGTTFAALSHLDARQVQEHFIEAMFKAQARARELGDSLGTPAQQ